MLRETKKQLALEKSVDFPKALRPNEKEETEVPLARLTPAQQSLVSSNIGLVRMHLRNRVPTPREPRREREYDDLFQEGCMGLIRAATRYRPDRDGSFAAYALPRIRGAIFAALHEGFTIIHVPARVTTASSSTEGPVYATQRPIKPLDATLTADPATDDARNVAGSADKIRHVIRRRFERAVREALADLRNRPWPRRNPCAIMARLSAERMLIPKESGRTPLRQIARESGVSSSRVSAYEQLLIDTVATYLSGDGQLEMLVRFARVDRAGFDGLVDEDRRERLSQVELEAFAARFERLERPARAELIYKLIQQSGADLPEVACNLFRMTQLDSEVDEALPLAG